MRVRFENLGPVREPLLAMVRRHLGATCEDLHLRGVVLAEVPPRRVGPRATVDHLDGCTLLPWVDVHVRALCA